MPLTMMYINLKFLRTLEGISKLKNYSTKPSYIHNIGKQPLKYTTIGNLLEETVNKFGERKAVISRHQNKSETFSEVLKRADQIAASFKILGLEKNDRLGIWLPNILEWYIVNMACARAGLISVCLNPVYEPSELEYCINKVGIKTLVCADKFKHYDYYQSLLRIVPELEECDPIALKCAKVPTLKRIITISEDKKRGTFNFEEILDMATPSDILNVQKLQRHISPDDPCNLHFTSGTTGKPKAALLSHFSLANNGFLAGKRMRLSDKHHKICMQVPFFHVFGTVVGTSASLNYGSTLVLPSIGYQSELSFNAIKEERCTVIYGSPTMFMDLIETQQRRKESISAEVAFIGSALSTPHLLQNILKVLNVKTINQAYGLTESTAIVFQSLMDEVEEKGIDNVGYVNEHIEVKVIDANGLVVPFGTAGELCVRGYSNMLGFWEDEEKTAEVLGIDGWLKTGDQFILEENGYGKVVGRLKDVIIRGGENIFPKETEELLATHPDIAEVHVIGIPHERLGEEVCACVRVKKKSELTLEDIVDFCKGKLAYFKIPTKISFFDKFPRTASGKVQKFKIKAAIIQRRIIN